MREIVRLFVDNINYIGAVALFLIGLHTVVTHRNLIKRILGINIMGTSVLLFLVSIGNVTGGVPPIIVPGENTGVFINPLPQVLILTGIVVCVSITVYSLSLAIRIFESYGTLDQDEITKIIKEQESHD
ncbi:MAG TPA: cation:proton antiporter subunit C [Bacilli bacterium]|nr:cation:proton antiporter subunit C [Bacilli bacterium]